MLLLLLPFAFLIITSVLATAELFYYASQRRLLLPNGVHLLMEFSALVMGPFLFFGLLNTMGADCCRDTPYLAPEHELSIEVLVLLVVGCYALGRWQTAIGSPVVELLINAGLVLGLALNAVLFVQINDGFWLLGNLPAVLLFLLALARRHHLALASWPDYHFSDGPLSTFCQRLLRQPAYQKYPLLLLVCLPLLAVVWVGLLLLGQQPDSLVRAFTDTYQHGFSKLQCDYDKCADQHFLCTIAAEGHPALVAPVRFGQRQGYRITVNRQLLVANAFEEILAERAPGLHRVVRRHYNRLGRACRRGFEQLRHPGLADAVYLLMKPLEWVFLLVIYTLETKPENRIARQYLAPEHQQQLRGRP